MMIDRGIDQDAMEEYNSSYSMKVRPAQTER